MVLSVREKGLRRLVIYDVTLVGSGLQLANERSISFPEDAYWLRGMGGEYKCVPFF